MRSSSASKPGLAFCGLALLLMSCPALGQSAEGAEVEARELAQPVAGPDIAPDIEPTNDEAAQLTKVTVTGSHIRRAQIEGPQPIQVITPDMVREVGGVKLGDYIPYVPINQLQTAAFPNQEGPAVDAFFNLRGLGYEATLTLVNGRRVSSYGGHGASTFVNVNAIPLAAIERVEILKDGASAIYGADAIAGVVNIILRRDYEGVDLSLSHSDTEAGGAAESSVELAAGKTFGNTNLMAVLSWYESDPLYSRDRDITANVDQRWRGGYNWRSIYSSPPNLIPLSTFAFIADPACPPDQSVNDRGWEYCGFNYAAFDYIVPGGERGSAQFFATHRLTPSVTLRAEIGYDDDTARRLLAPDVWPAPIVPAAHPDNPLGENLAILYRYAEGPSRDWRSDTTGRRTLLEAEILTGSWAWAAHAAWSDSKTDNRVGGIMDVGRQQAALLGQGGPTGDQWFNPFGVDPQNDPALVNWILDTDISDSRTRLRTIGVVGDGPAFDFPAGPAGIAIGAEYRYQQHWLHDDPRFYPGLAPPEEENIAARQVRSAFVEVGAPLMGALEIQLAGRLEDYSDFGSHLSPKIALAWRPGNAVLVRASYAESFRAPQFQDLYAQTRENRPLLEDPLRCPVTQNAYDCQGDKQLLQLGNPDLEPETGESWFVGTVWSPERLRGLDVQLDLWRLKYDDRVEWIDADFALENFALDPAWVKRADPTPDDQALGIPGRAETIFVRPINLGKVETQGVDIGLRYHRSLAVGEFTGELAATYVDDYRVTDPATNEWDYNGKDVAGTEEWTGPMPRWKAVASLSWARGANGATAVVRFVGSYEDSMNWPGEGGIESERPHQVGSWTTVDLQYRRSFRNLGEGRLSLGCSNCSDRDPPLALSNSRGFPEGLANVFGRRWFARWSQPFGGVGD